MSNYTVQLALEIISGRKKEIDWHDYTNLEWCDYMGPKYIGAIHDSVKEQAEKIIYTVLKKINYRDA